MLSHVAALDGRGFVMKAIGKKRIGIIAVLACVLVLCFTLVGCGSGNSTDNSANFKGEYKLVGMEEDGITYSEDDLAFMEELGLDFGLTLADEGKATLNLAGESMDGTWEAKSNKECTITIGSDSIKATLDGDNLKCEDGGSSLTFKKA